MGWEGSWPQHTSGEQKTASGIWFPSFYLVSPGAKLKWSVLVADGFTHWTVSPAITAVFNELKQSVDRPEMYNGVFSEHLNAEQSPLKLGEVVPCGACRWQ